MAPEDDLTGHSLLAVFSHPDDESLSCGGLLACCAVRGARVTLVCATHGEHGPHNDVPVDGAAGLSERRALELSNAARTLGIAEVVLLDHSDGYLPWIEATRLEAEVLDTIVRVRPEVVVTFGADGLYWHPDHIAVHHRTTAAVSRLGAEAPALYYVTMPPGRMRHIAECLPMDSETAVPSLFGVADLDAFGAGAAPPTLIVDVSAFAVRKLAALRCHETQLIGGPVARMTDADAMRLLGTEHFHRAAVGSMAPTFIERFALRVPLDTV